MKKLFALLLLSVFFFSFASAAEFDNVMTYNEQEDTITFENRLGWEFIGGGVVVEAKLTENFCSDGRFCYADKTITLYEESVLIEDFKTLRIDDDSWDEQNIRWHRLEYWGEIEDYETQCHQEERLNYTNETYYEEVCEEVLTGLHEDWIQFKEGEVFDSGTYEVKTSGEIKPGRLYDWQVKINGDWTTPWAVWGNISLGDDAEVILNSPADNEIVLVNTVPFNASANVTGGATLTNMSLFTNESGSWQLEQTTMTEVKMITGESLGVSFDGFSWNNTASEWYSDSDFADGLPSLATIREFPTMFFIGENLHLIYGQVDGTFTGYSWNGTSWLANATMNSGLPDVGLYSTPTTFYENGNLYLIAGEGNPSINSYIWTGSTWASNTTIRNGLSVVSGEFAATSFYIGNDLYLLGETFDGADVLYGWKWNGATWVTDADIKSGITLDNRDRFAHFNRDGEDYLLQMVAGGDSIGYSWNSSGWDVDTDAKAGLPANMGDEVVPATIAFPLDDTQTFNQTITDTTLWNVQACDSDGDCGFATANRTVFLDTSQPTISVESPTGTQDYGAVGLNETLNVTFTDTNLDSCWFNYNGTNITIDGCLTGIKNSTNFILEAGNTQMTVYANDSVGNENSTEVNWNYTYLENGRIHNTTSFETASELFSINVEGPSSAVLVYNGTDYSTSKSGDNFNVTIQVPLGNLGNRSLHWRFDDTTNSFTSYQNVSGTVFALCNATYTEDFLNITFKNEADLAALNASIPTSTFEYYLGDGTLTKSLTYVESSNNYNYKFCVTPSDRILKVLPTVQYKQGILYPQRTWEPAVQTYNNTLTTQILYLLNTIDGLFVTFQTINPANQVLSGVEVEAVREIGGEDITVGTGTTGASGTVTLWLNPDFSHDFTFSKSGLPTISESFPPTQTSYTITMAGETLTENSTIRGIDYSIIPINTFLENDTEYTFGFQLNSSFWDVEEYGFNLRLANGTIITGDATGTEGTSLTKSYDVNNQTLIYLDAFWTINGNSTSFTRFWAIQNTEYTGYSIAFFFTDLNTYMDSGLFGIDEFGRYLIAFIILFISVGLVGQKFGISSPLGVLTLTFTIVFFLDVVTGIIPTIGGATNGIENLPTYLAGLILAIAALNEVRLRI